MYPPDLAEGAIGMDTGGELAGVGAAALAAGFNDMLANISILGFSCCTGCYYFLVSSFFFENKPKNPDILVYKFKAPPV